MTRLTSALPLLSLLALSLFSSGISQCEGGDDTPTPTPEPIPDVVEVSLETSMGTMILELDHASAPVTVENFLRYLEDGFYDGADGLGATTFHRVIEGFVIQGGGYTEDGTAKATYPPIVLESNNGLSNLRGTIAMARSSRPDSATSQFYINHVDNTGLDYQSDAQPGYAVFGQVVEGLDVVDAIAAVETDDTDTPLVDVVITSCLWLR